MGSFIVLKRLYSTYFCQIWTKRELHYWFCLIKAPHLIRMTMKCSDLENGV